MIAGPTPAFQASLLEMESGLRGLRAHLDAQRAQAGYGKATATEPGTVPPGAGSSGSPGTPAQDRPDLRG